MVAGRGRRARGRRRPAWSGRLAIPLLELAGAGPGGCRVRAAVEFRPDGPGLGLGPGHEVYGDLNRELADGVRVWKLAACHYSAPFGTQ